MAARTAACLRSPPASPIRRGIRSVGVRVDADHPGVQVGVHQVAVGVEEAGADVADRTQLQQRVLVGRVRSRCRSAAAGRTAAGCRCRPAPSSGPASGPPHPPSRDRPADSVASPRRRPGPGPGRTSGWPRPAWPAPRAAGSPGPGRKRRPRRRPAGRPSPRRRSAADAAGRPPTAASDSTTRHRSARRRTGSPPDSWHRPSRARPDGRLIAVDVGHDRLQQAVPLLQRLLEIGVHALGDDHHRADDADLTGPLQQPGDLGLGDVQDAGDLALPQLLLVVEVRDLGHQPHLAVGGNAGHTSGLRHLTVPLLARARPWPSLDRGAVALTAAVRSEATAPAPASGPGDRRGCGRRSRARRPVRSNAVRRAADPPAGQVGGAERGHLGQVGHLHRSAEQIGLGLHDQRRGGQAAVGADARQRAGRVAVDDLHDVADLVGHRVDGGAGDAGRIAVGVELGEDPAYPRSQCGAPSPVKAGTRVTPPASATVAARLEQIGHARRPSSRAAQARVAPDDRMLPSRAYGGVVGEPGQRGRDGGGAAARTSAVGVITDVPVPYVALAVPTVGAPVAEQGGVRVGQHRGDRQSVRETRHRAAATEVAVGALHLGQHGRRDVEQLEQSGGPGEVDDVVEEGAGRVAGLGQTCRSPAVSRQTSQESTVPTQTSARADRPRARAAASRSWGRRTWRRSGARSGRGPARRPAGPVRSRHHSAVRTSCQPITGPSGSPGASVPGHHRLALGGQGHRRQVEVRGVDRGQAAVDGGQHAGPDAARRPAPPSPDAGGVTPTGAEPTARTTPASSTSTALLLVVPWSMARIWVIG